MNAADKLIEEKKKEAEQLKQLKQQWRKDGQLPAGQAAKVIKWGFRG